MPRNDALLARTTRDRVAGPRARDRGRRADRRAGPAAALPRRVYWVALYSTSLEDVDETVAFIRNRLLLATAAALLVALIGGYLVAQALSRRVRRVEEAAEQVAAGRFIDPLPVDSKDELGQLTRAFNEMQVQLRQVDVARKEFVATASHELRHADLLARRLPGAAARRGPGRGDPARVPGHRGRADRAPAEAGGEPAGPVAPGRRVDPAPPPGGRPVGAGAGGHRRVQARRAAPRAPSSRCASRPGFGPPATGKGWLRSCVSCSTMRCATRPRART